MFHFFTSKFRCQSRLKKMTQCAKTRAIAPFPDARYNVDARFRQILFFNSNALFWGVKSATHAIDKPAPRTITQCVSRFFSSSPVATTLLALRHSFRPSTFFSPVAILLLPWRRWADDGAKALPIQNYPYRCRLFTPSTRRLNLIRFMYEMGLIGEVTI